MTTLSVTQAPTDRILPLDMPSYNYPHPSIRTVHLAAVKDGIFHPTLPSLRRMSMDDVMCKLTNEHCRTTTTCCRADFSRATTSLFERAPDRLPSMGITESGRAIYKHFTMPDELTKARMEWSSFLNKCPERYNIRLHELPCNGCKGLEFSGYATRYMRPQVTESWKRPLARYIPTASQLCCHRCSLDRSTLPF